ncbi:MAG: translocation/assembly module TamB domain-containing protein [Candidatus Sericytochromatia bacterium]|nr:translocation/assembly module TamB domain-containing protein [Candidatus Sericytochromatia bacterium]
MAAHDAEHDGQPLEDASDAQAEDRSQAQEAASPEDVPPPAAEPPPDVLQDEQLNPAAGSESEAGPGADATADAIADPATDAPAEMEPETTLRSLPGQLLGWGLRYALMTVCLLILGLVALLYRPPDYLLDQGARLIERLVLQQTGLPLEIGRIARLELRPWRQRVVLENLVLYGHVGATRPALVIPRAELNSHLLDFLLQREQLARLDIDYACIWLQRDAQGQINLKPVFQPSEPQAKDDSPPPRLPRVLLTLNHTLIQYQDQAENYPLDERLSVPLLRADLQEDGALSAQLQLRHGLLGLRARTELGLFSGQGQALARLRSLDLAPATAYAHPLKDFQVLSGQLAADLSARWPSREGLPAALYQGQLKLDALQARLPHYPRPVRLDARLQLDQDRLQVDALSLASADLLLQISGAVRDYRKDWQADLDVRLPRLNIALINRVQHPALKTVQALRMQGLARSQLSLRGGLKQLTVKGELDLPRFAMPEIALQNASTRFSYQHPQQQASGDVTLAQGRWRNVLLHQLSSRYDYNPQRVEISRLSAQAFSGSVQASARLGLDKRQALQAKIQARQVSLEQLQQELGLKLPPDYAPAGRVDLQANAWGSLKAPQAKGQLVSSRIGFPLSQKLQPLLDLQTRFEYSPAQAQLALRTNSTDAGLVTAAARLRQNDALSASLELTHLPLKTVNKWAPQAYIQQGTARLRAELTGSLRQLQRNWMAFNARADFDADDLDLQLQQADRQIVQHFDRAELRARWQQGQLSLSHLLLRNGDSRLQGDGEIAVPRLLAARDPHKQVLQIRLDGDLELADFPLLQDYAVEQGQVKLALSAQSLGDGHLKASLDSTAQRLRLRGVSLERLELTTQLADQRLQIDTARLVQAEDQLDIVGSVDLSQPSPALDLLARSDQFRLETLVSLLPESLRARFEPQPAASQSLPEPDPLPRQIGLPQIAQRQTFRPNPETSAETLTPEGLSLSWRPIYEHWARWKLPPNTERRAGNQVSERNPLETLRGELSLNARVQGTVKTPAVQLQSLLTGLKYQDSEVSETFVDATFKDQRLKLTRLHLLEANGAVLEVSGDLDLNEDMDLVIEGRGLRLKSADPFVSDNLRLEGELDFKARATGSLKDPRVQADLNLDRLLLNRYFFDQVASQASYRDRYLKDTAVQVVYGDQRVLARGDVPVPDLNQPMDVLLELKDESFGLLNLFTQSIDWRGGKGLLQVRVVGTPKKPQLEGEITLEDNEIYIAALRESVKNLQLKGVLQRYRNEKGVLQQNVELASVTGDFGGGKVQATGRMDLLNLLPSYFDLQTTLDKVTVRYTYPGLFETTTPVESANIRIMGLVEQPIISGRIQLGRNGTTIFPFLRDQSDLPVSNSVEEEKTRQSKPPRILFGGLRVQIPYDYQLNSPIFDIPVRSPQGINLRHSASLLTLNGNVSAEEGALYLLNNILNIEQLKVAFRPPQTPTDPALNPNFNLRANFKVDDVAEPVLVNIDGSLERLRNRTMQFTFDNSQGLSEGQLLGKLVGLDAAQSLGQGDFAGVASQFSDAVLRGLFDPLTSRISSLLGLEELSFGIAGQSVMGPEFRFTIRSNPFFLVDEWIEENLEQLNFLNKIRIRSNGYLGEQVTYDLGANYRFNANWSLDYNFEQLGSIHNVHVKGNYMLDFVLRWMDYVRTRFFGWEPETAAPATALEPTPSPEPAPAPASAAELSAPWGAGLW